MNNPLTLLIAALIVLVLGFYMLFYQVSFDEHAVVTTFQRAEAPVYAEDGTIAEPNSVVTTPGIRFKAPWPIQNVHRYPKKVQLLPQEKAQLLTADEISVVLRTYVTWRIVDPYAFFVELQNLETVRQRLNSQVQNLQGEFSRYRFDEMVNTDPSRLRLTEIEDEVTQKLRERIAGLGYGIEIERVGINRLLLPESTTQEVFARMRSTRERLAASAKQEGENTATAIRAEAERVKGQILSFADAEASRIRAEGVREGLVNYDVFAQNPELAIFLAQIETLRQMLPGSTLILDANAMQFLDLLTGRTNERTAGNDE
ncbi:MAG: SPFH domain-containing protein [Planctomycetota bacterium]